MATEPRRGGLRRRWMINSIVPVIVLLFLISAMVSVALASNYYSGAQSALEAKVTSGTEYFNTYVMDGYEAYYRTAALYVDTFDNKDRMELQFLDTKGRVEISSRNFSAGTQPGTEDILQALSTGEVSCFTGRNANGERIISVSGLLKFNGGVVGVMRFTTSLRNIDSQAMMTVFGVLSITLTVIFLILMSSMLFINNVVSPVSAVSEAAKRISSGSYGIRIPNPYADEMKELVDNINDMSIKIGQNERMQTEFVSSVSHELRTPLTAINGWGETLLADVENGDSEAMRRGLTIICKESRRLTNMVEELLDFSKMADGRFTLQMAEMDLQAEFEDAIYTYHELFKQDGIALNYTSGQELYEQTIDGDAERLKQVFCNLLDNARKHGGSGKRIDARLNRKGNQYIITIRDYGPGIPPTELPFVKKKFYKGSSKARGSGIGLAVCDEIIKLHNGTFDIGNARGGGTIATVKLPIKMRKETNNIEQVLHL